MGATANLRLVVLFAILSADGHAQDLSGYTRAAVTPLPDSLQENRLNGRFRVSVVRVAASAAERQLIEHAESLIPPKEAIENATRGITGRGNVVALEAAAQQPGPRWWWRDWDGVLLPFALTGAAVAHYIDRVRTLSAQPNPFARNEPGIEHNASVQYSARVTTAREHPGNVEVQMQVQFHFYCGRRCSLSFSHTRVVEFDSTGTLVASKGDHAPTFGVS